MPNAIRCVSIIIMEVLMTDKNKKSNSTEILEYPDILYTIPETAHLLRVNKNTVYQLINNGYLRSIKLGCRKVSRKAILDFIEQYVR